MEHWNKENPNTTTYISSIESTSRKPLRMVLENIASKQYESYERTSSDDQADKRRKIQDILETRLAYLFPRSDGIHLSRKWVTHGFFLLQYEMLFDQQTLDRILSKKNNENNNLEEIREEGILQINILLLLLAYIVKIHQKNDFPKVRAEYRSERTKEILKLTLDLSKNGPLSDVSKEKLVKLWDRYRSLKTIQDMFQASVDCQLDSDLINIISLILKTTPEIITETIEENSNLNKILKHSQTYISAWVKELKNIERTHQQNFDELQTSMFFTEDDANTLLCDIETGFLYCLFGALPYKDRSDFYDLQTDNWEIIPEDTRTRLIEYIKKLSYVPDIMIRYIRAYDEYDYWNQIEDTLLKLRNPWYYRIRKKMTKIACILDDNDIPADKQVAIEDTLNGLIGELNAFDFTHANECYSIKDLPDVINIDDLNT